MCESKPGEVICLRGVDVDGSGNELGMKISRPTSVPHFVPNYVLFFFQKSLGYMLMSPSGNEPESTMIIPVLY